MHMWTWPTGRPPHWHHTRPHPHSACIHFKGHPCPSPTPRIISCQGGFSLFFKGRLRCHPMAQLLSENVSSWKVSAIWRKLRPIPASIYNILFEIVIYISLADQNMLHGWAEEGSTGNLQRLQKPQSWPSLSESESAFFFFFFYKIPRWFVCTLKYEKFQNRSVVVQVCLQDHQRQYCLQFVIQLEP